MALDATFGDRIAELILPSLHREYPNKIAHVMTGDGDARPPRELFPAFYGCFDWHSSVHSHWTIARLLRELPAADWADEAAAALSESLTADNIAGEIAYMSPAHRAGFEMPYGIAWLLCLASELAQHDEPWSQTLEPLVELGARRFAAWIEKLPSPIRSGQHAQSAFAIGLALDYARAAGRDELADTIRARSLVLYGDDTGGAIAYEPSGYDFLSPCLAEAELLARVMDEDDFENWFREFLPAVDLEPVTPPDRSDGKLVHLDGLNLSRAWMLWRIGTALGRDDLKQMARAHFDAGMDGVSAEHYEGAHWLGTFAVYAAVVLD